MPYIEPSKRLRLDPFIKDLDQKIDTIGELAYVIYVLSLRYLNATGQRFSTMATIYGCLKYVTDTFKSNKMDPYEANKRIINGDVEVF
jgi:hypothetical protein